MCAMRVVQTDVFDEGDLSKHIAVPVSFVWDGDRQTQPSGGRLRETKSQSVRTTVY